METKAAARLFYSRTEEFCSEYRCYFPKIVSWLINLLHLYILSLSQNLWEKKNSTIVAPLLKKNNGSRTPLLSVHESGTGISAATPEQSQGPSAAIKIAHLLYHHLLATASTAQQLHHQPLYQQKPVSVALVQVCTTQRSVYIYEMTA